MAAIDIDMSQFTVKNTLAGTDYISGTLADGSAVKIKVSDIASVVAGMNVQTNVQLTSGGVYESVDLGLPSGTLWAKHNIGATSESDYGDLFAWGATEPYRLNGTTPIDNTNNYAASYANKIQHDLYPNEDAATVNWGKGWRMPTKAQFQELKNNTDGGEYTIISGKEGVKFTASNGNYIFFPSAGLYGGSSITNRGNTGYYWSRSFYDNNRGTNLVFHSSVIKFDNYERSYGFTIRPIRSN